MKQSWLLKIKYLKESRVLILPWLEKSLSRMIPKLETLKGMIDIFHWIKIQKREMQNSHVISSIKTQ